MEGHMESRGWDPWGSCPPQSSSWLTLHRVSLGSWFSGWDHISRKRISAGLVDPGLRRGRGLHPPSWWYWGALGSWLWDSFTLQTKMEKAHWEMEILGVESKGHCCAQTSSLALSPWMWFYPLVSASRKDCGQTHQHLFTYILSKLISFLFSSNLELAGSPRSSCEISVRVKTSARLVLSPARQSQSHGFAFSVWVNSVIHAHLYLSRSFQELMHPWPLHLDNQWAKNFNKATLPDQPHLDKSMFPLILYP